MREGRWGEVIASRNLGNILVSRLGLEWQGVWVQNTKLWTLNEMTATGGSRFNFSSWFISKIYSVLQFKGRFVCCIFFFILTTLKAISRRLPPCDGTQSWWICCAGPLRNQAASTITWYPHQSHYPNTEPNSPCPILIIPSTWLGSDKYQFYKSLVWLNQDSNPRGLNLPISQNGRWTLYSFGHFVWAFRRRRYVINISCFFD